MSVQILSIELNERDGKLFVDSSYYNNSYPDYSEESYYPTWGDSKPFEEWAEQACYFEWEELVNNTSHDISELQAKKIKDEKEKYCLSEVKPYQIYRPQIKKLICYNVLYYLFRLVSKYPATHSVSVVDKVLKLYDRVKFYISFKLGMCRLNIRNKLFVYRKQKETGSKNKPYLKLDVKNMENDWSPVEILYKYTNSPEWWIEFLGRISTCLFEVTKENLLEKLPYSDNIDGDGVYFEINDDYTLPNDFKYTLVLGQSVVCKGIITDRVRDGVYPMYYQCIEGTDFSEWKDDLPSLNLDSNLPLLNVCDDELPF